MPRSLAFLVLFFAILLAACGRKEPPQPAASTIHPDKYYAVLLTNGSVYFGHLEGIHTDLPVLRDVYYVQSSVHPETKAVSNILVKRGKEWHAPDRMILNAGNIVFVEPVGADSKVAQLIAESKK